MCRRPTSRRVPKSREGVWYFIKNTLKGHLRSEGRMLTFGAGVPSMTVASYENLLKNARPEGKMLGDCDTWDELDQFGSIIVGSPVNRARRCGS